MTPGPHLKLNALRCLLANSAYSLQEEKRKSERKGSLSFAIRASRQLDPRRDQERKNTEEYN